MVVALAMPLPFANRNEGNVAEAQLLALRASSEIRVLEVGLNARLAVAYESLEDARTESTSLRDAVLPELQKAFDLTNSGYLAGRFSYLELAESRRALADARAQYVQALVNYQKAATSIRELAGELPR